MGKFWNFMGNTFWGVPRAGWTATLAGIDTLKTGANVLTDMGTIITDTSDKLREVLSSSRNTGKRYNKLYQVPAWVVVGAWTLLEGAVRTVLEPSRNAILNVRDTTGNFFKNIGNTIGRLFDTTKPASDFSFEKLKTKKPTGQNWFSKRAFWNREKPEREKKERGGT